MPTRTLEGVQALEYTCDALQTLVVVANDSVPFPDNGTPITVPINIFLNAPQLRKVELWDVFDVSYRIQLPTKQITEFTDVFRGQFRWSYNHVQSILNFLQSASDLQHLTGTCDDSEMLELSSSIARCPPLRSLRISFDLYGHGGFPYLLQHIAAQSLTPLDVGSTCTA